MPKASPIQQSFNAGEFSPLLHGRTDFEKYGSGLRVCRNYVPLVQGPLIRRPGTYHIGEVKDSSRATRLVSFEFSTTQAYVLEFGHEYIRFYMDHGQIVSGASAYEISTPYAEADLFELKFAQSADVLYIAHPDYAPRKLSRTGHTAWTLEEVGTDTWASGSDDWPPFLDENVGVNVQFYLYGSSSPYSLESQAAGVFDASHVGAYFKLTVGALATHYTQWAQGQSVSVGDRRYYGGRVYEAYTAGTTDNRAPVHEAGTESDGGVEWTFISGTSGYVKIESVSNDALATCSIVNTPPISIPSTKRTTPEYRWSEGAWSDYQGYPATVTFYEDRLCWGGTSRQPQTMWMSRTGDYEDYSRTTPDGTVTDDSGIMVTLGADTVNAIRWIIDDERGLLLGTVGGEWLIRSSTAGEPLTPTNVQAKRPTTYGSANIAPLRAGKQTLYVQRAQRKIRELAYVFESDGFLSPDVSLLAEHITQGGLVELAYQQEPFSIVWAVCGDGRLLGLTYARDQDVVGWHEHLLGGTSDAAGTRAAVESVAVIPAPDGTRDELWMVVKRYIDGATVRHIEYMTKFWEEGDDQEDAFFVDAGLSYDGAAATNISGLDHLEGETVSVLADGAVHPDVTVSAGAITLQREASKVHIGLGYESDGQTLRIEAGAADGTAQGKTKRIHRVTMRLHETLGLKTGRDADNLNEVTFRTSADATNAPPPLYSGDLEVPWEGAYDKDGYVYWRQDQPLPGTILAIMPQLITQDR